MSVSFPRSCFEVAVTPSPQLTVLTAACISGNFSRVEIIQQFDTPDICGLTGTSSETATEYSVLVTVTPCGGGGELTSLSISLDPAVH